MSLLAINIPTYQRFESFCEVILELEQELCSLSNHEQSQIEVNIFDNASLCSKDKALFCNEVATRSNLKINVSINTTNVGADRNILKCCTAAPHSLYTWVLGDDDHIIKGSLAKVIEILQKQNDLGLLILADKEYEIKQSILACCGRYSYFDFAQNAVKVQPHLLIAHSLISCNIFRTDVFIAEESRYMIEILTPRVGLRANFAHMRGMVSGLFRNDNRYIHVTSFNVLDTSHRLDGEIDLSSEIFRIYYYYYMWLLSELGIRIDQIVFEERLWWLFDSSSICNKVKLWLYRKYYFIRRLLYRISR